MAGDARDRFFGRIAGLTVGRPKVVLLAALVICVIAGALLPGLGVSTSRTSLVSDDDPQQRRLNRFYDRFGRPDAPIFVVSGGDEQQRRAVVDAITAKLSENEELHGRVLGRVRPRDVAKIILLQQPDAMAKLRASLPPGTDLARLFEGGLDGWLAAIEQQINAGLDGAEDGGEDAQGAGVEIEQTAAGLQQLALVAKALDDHLGGDDPLGGLGNAQTSGPKGVDESGYLVSGSGEDHLVAVYADLDSDEGRVLQPFIEELRSARDAALADAPEGVTADLSGLPAIAVDELTSVREGLVSSSIAATLGIFGLCLLLFRSLRQTIVALIPLGPGILLTLAATRLLYDDLNLITSSFVAVLLGLGIDFAVHLVSRRNEEVREGATEAAALTGALRRTGPGIATGAAVTAAAFLTTATTDFTAYGELGIITAIGLVAVVASTFFLIPPLLIVGNSKTARAAPLPPGLGALPGVIRRLKLPLIVVGLLAGIAGAIALPRIEFDSRYFGFLPQSTESARALARLEYDSLASPVFASLTAESIEEAREMSEQLRGMDTVAGVQTPSDLLPELGPAQLAALQSGFAGIERDPDFSALGGRPLSADPLRKQVVSLSDALDEARFALEGAGLPTDGATAARDAFASLGKRLASLDEPGHQRLASLHADLAEILDPAWSTARAVAARGAYSPEDLPPLFARRFVSRDGELLAVHAVPSGRFWEVAVADAFAADVRRVDEDAIGLALVHVEHGQMILRGIQRAAGVAAIVIALLLLLDFRSVRDAALALLPTALGWLWMLGLMALLGLTFNVANIVSMPLVLGIGIAFGVHMMHRAREPVVRAPDDSGPIQARADIAEVIKGTGAAIAVAALTTMVGFAGLMVADYGGMKSLGLVMVMGIGCCLLATVLVLPAVLLVLRRAD